MHTISTQFLLSSHIFISYIRVCAEREREREKDRERKEEETDRQTEREYEKFFDII